MSDETPDPKVADEDSLGFLVARMTEQTSQLVRSEVDLAKAEMAQSGKGLGLGAGLFGGAGVLALYGLGTLVAAAVLGLAAGGVRLAGSADRGGGDLRDRRCRGAWSARARSSAATPVAPGAGHRRSQGRRGNRQGRPERRNP